MIQRKTILAALCAVAFGTAHAQSSVQIYGVVDLNIDRESTGTSKVIKMDQGLLVSNKLGFLGKEDLGGGTSAQFQLESGFFPDSGSWDSTTRAFNRQSWVGLVNDRWGAVKFGRIRTLLYQYDWDYLDASGNATTPASFRLFNFFGNRTDNIVEYSWAGAGLKAAVQYGFGEVAGNSRGSRTIAEMLAYDLGHLKLLVVNHKQWNAAGTDAQRATTFGGNYDFGFVRAYAAAAVNRGFGALDTRDSLVGFNMPAGPNGRFVIQYVRKHDRAIPRADANLFGVAYTYDLSKRTTLYATGGRLENDPAASYMVTTPGKTWTQVAAGITHRF
jgi:predicted porin